MKAATEQDKLMLELAMRLFERALDDRVIRVVPDDPSNAHDLEMCGIVQQTFAQLVGDEWFKSNGMELVRQHFEGVENGSDK